MRRRITRVLAMVVCLLTVAVAAGLPVFVYPQIDQLRHADAIFILSGPYHRRYPYGFELAEQGWAPNLVVSNPTGGYDRSLVDYCAAPHLKFAVHCFVPRPTTTRGEARELRLLASQYGWRTVIVVTFRPHISRSRFILRRCFDGDLVMVASPAPMTGPRWAYEYAYQSAGYVRAALQPGC